MYVYIYIYIYIYIYNNLIYIYILYTLFVPFVRGLLLLLIQTSEMEVFVERC